MGDNPARLLRLHHVQLAMPAGGEPQAITFYQGLLGIRHVPKPERLAKRGGCWFESPDGAVKVHLGVEADFRPARKAHPALLVEDLAALGDRLRHAGHAVTDDGNADQLYVDDPFGNRIELLQAPLKPE